MQNANFYLKYTRVPFLEQDTRVLVTPAAVAQSLVGATDPDTGAPLDYISNSQTDGAEGLLSNCVLYHGRNLLVCLDDDQLCDSDSLRNLSACTSNVRTLVPRNKSNPFVHTLLPADYDTIGGLAFRCMRGQMCIRMASAKLILSAVMLYYSLFTSTGRDAVWSDDDVARLHELDNIV